MLMSMDFLDIVKALDDRIATLQQARTLLNTTAVPATEKRAKAAVEAIQPKAAKTAPEKTPAKATSGRKPMSDEGRARIAAAQKQRWALKHAGGSTAAKKTGAKTAPAKAVPAKKATVAKAVASKQGPAKKAEPKKTEPKKSVAKKSAITPEPAATEAPAN